MASTSAPMQTQFPCSQCGAGLQFEPGKAALVCPYCGATTPVPQANQVIEELDYQTYLRGLPPEETEEVRLAVHCNTCGAQTQLGKNLTADKCIFCGSPVVAEKQSRRLIKPRAMLPFAINRTKAQADFKDWLSALWFAPTDLLKAAECGGLVGVYIPFWTFDADAHTRYIGERGEDYWETEVYTEFINGQQETRTRQVRRTRWWPASGEVDNHFDDLLVMASNTLPPKQASHLEPWDLPRLVAYADEYLAGFAAESYQVDLPNGFQRAQQLAEPEIRNTVCADIGGDHQRILNIQPQFANVTFKHILLPLWISAYSYGGKTYRFLINARTGAVQGERPYSVWKIVFLILAIFAAIMLIALLHLGMH
jgi:DNA-directed RNA polymerase subunit RPC12/RpoP